MLDKFDLHSHSHYSDGVLTPCELMDYAIERELKYLALTDHDSISGLSEAQNYLTKINSDLKLINGIELSALTDYGEVHIVGLGIDPTNVQLNEALSMQQEKRWRRAEEIEQRLQKIGVTGVLDWCKDHVKQVITRTHIAKALVELGYVKDMNQAFKKYIGKQGRIKVAKDWINIKDAIKIIQQAGGISVLAHPTRYKISNRKLSYLILEFAEKGGDGIEMAYPSLNADKKEWLKTHQEKSSLLASSGSDFHYPNLRWTDLGRFPQLDKNIPHVINKLV